MHQQILVASLDIEIELTSCEYFLYIILFISLDVHFSCVKEIVLSRIYILFKSSLSLRPFNI